MTLADVKTKLSTSQKTWLLTGCAGFIGSHLLETLLEAEQKVVGIDNFSTGSTENLESVKSVVGPDKFKNFQFHNSDLVNLENSHHLFEGVDYVLHHAAQASVPQSVESPLDTFKNNVLGTEVVFELSRKAKVKKVVYASSSAVYGDDEAKVKQENQIGRPLSPYANSKKVNELQALQLSQVYNIPTVGLRYFNVFGSRQKPDGPYAAVIPSWTQALHLGQPVIIHGDGKQTRDFLNVKDVVKANLLATLHDAPSSSSLVFNVAGGTSVSLLELLETLSKAWSQSGNSLKISDPEFEPERPGDIRHSLGSVDFIQKTLGFGTEVTLLDGLTEMMTFSQESSP